MRAVDGHQLLFCFANLLLHADSVCLVVSWAPDPSGFTFCLCWKRLCCCKQRGRGKITGSFGCPLLCWCRFHKIPSDAFNITAWWYCLCSPSYNIQISLSNETGHCPKPGSMLLPPISRLATCRLGWIGQRAVCVAVPRATVLAETGEQQGSSEQYCTCQINQLNFPMFARYTFARSVLQSS